ncbi:MAG: hypothetical protein ACFFC7_12310 [Candidatus Hermodarchaeota archaeon]
MKYEIKSYQEEFLDDQVRIGTEMLSKWRLAGQTPKDGLKKHYSQPDFDPETRLYAFYQGEMVGFVTSMIIEEKGVKKARMEIPIVMGGHEEARKLLFEKAIEVLKNKGAIVLRTRAGEYWGNTVQLAKEYGFTYTTYHLRGSQKRFDEIDSSKLLDPVDVKTYDPKTHADKLLQLVMKQYNVPEENARLVVERYEDWNIGEVKNPFGVPQKLVFHLIMIGGEEIAGRALGFQSELYGQNTVELTSLYVKDSNENVRGQLLAAGIRESKKMGFEELVVHISEFSGEKDEYYTPYGFEFSTKLGYYEKEI